MEYTNEQKHLSSAAAYVGAALDQVRRANNPVDRSTINYLEALRDHLMDQIQHRTPVIQDANPLIPPPIPDIYAHNFGDALAIWRTNPILRATSIISDPAVPAGEIWVVQPDGRKQIIRLGESKNADESK